MKYASLMARSVSAAAAFLIGCTIYASAVHAQDSGQPVVYEGTVTVAVEDDFERGRATRRYFIDEQNLGRRFELKVNKAQGDKLGAPEKRAIYKAVSWRDETAPPVVAKRSPLPSRIGSTVSSRAIRCMSSTLSAISASS